MSTTESIAELLAQAWQLAYLDPLRARDIGRQVIERTRHEPGSVEAGHGWLHIALAEVRLGDPDLAKQATQHARAVFDRIGNLRGVCLADEVRAISLRRSGEHVASQQLQAEIDARDGRDYDDNDHFIAHNSRAITHKLLGRNDEALRHFHHAYASALRTGWPGPKIVALGNLGGFHHDLFNLEDAKKLSEEALALARRMSVRQVVGNASANLITIYHAAGQPERALAVAQAMLSEPDSLLPDALDQLSTTLALAFLGVGDIESAERFLSRGAQRQPADGDGIGLWSWLQARCALARHDAQRAEDVARRALEGQEQGRISVQPYDLMQLFRAVADAREQLGDLAGALACTRRAHALYEELVGRSARARYIALEVAHEVASARHERDQAVLSRDSADEDRRRLAELNQQLQATLAETASLQAQLREQAVRDPLTGLHNRRHLFEAAPQLIELALRQRSDLCVALIDLDHFKAFNDSWGHAAGDTVLLAFADLASQILRRSDVIARHGGEEFVVVMPDIGIIDAMAAMERLLQAFTAMPLKHGRQSLPPCSFSAGLAALPQDGQTLDQLLSRADRALYRAKGGGRSSIEAATPGERITII